MSRRPRAGEAGKPVTLRATDTERAAWLRAAKIEGCSSLSAAIVKVMNEWAARTAPTPRRKRKRCPDCNQLLYILADGSIEPHMQLPSLGGGDPVVCIPERAEVSAVISTGSRSPST